MAKSACFLIVAALTVLAVTFQEGKFDRYYSVLLLLLFSFFFFVFVVCLYVLAIESSVENPVKGVSFVMPHQR